MDIGVASAQWALRQPHLKLFYFDELPSTNRWCHEWIHPGVQNTHLILARHQTQGRGRGQHTWSDPIPGSNFAGTWVFALGAAQPKPPLPAKIGLILIESCLSVWPRLPWSLKAPNDLKLNQKKVAGLLIESIGQDKQNWLMIGLGMNVLQAPQVDVPTTSLLLACNENRNEKKLAPLDLKTDWEKFLSTFFERLQELAENLKLNPENSLLSSTEQKRLLFHLRNTVEHQELTQVDARGQLHTVNSIQSWDRD